MNVGVENLSDIQLLCNKVPKTGWFRTTAIHSLTIHKARSPNWRCWQDWFLQEGSEDESVPWVSVIFWCSWKSLVSLGLWVHNSNSSYDYLPNEYLSSNGVPSLWVSIQLTYQGSPHLNLYDKSAKTLFPNKSTLHRYERLGLQHVFLVITKHTAETIPWTSASHREGRGWT